MTTKIYVAGAWAEMADRAIPRMDQVREAGLVVTYDWTVGEAEGELSPQERVVQAQNDLRGVFAADIVWVLASDAHGAGHWVELGAVLSLRHVFGGRGGPHVVVSGPGRARTIFTVLADYVCEDDEEALAYVRTWAEESERS